MTEGTEKVDTPKASAKAATLEEKISRGVDNWLDANLRNTAFSRDTDAWNILKNALPSLAGTIAKEVK